MGLSRVTAAALRFVEHGTGVPLVALHGVGVDHREMEAAIEAVVPGGGYRRIYPDLPGMGGSPADGLTCNDDVVAVLAEFVGSVAGGAGAAARPLLRRPPGPRCRRAPTRGGARPGAGFDEYFVVRTPATARRYRDHVVPGTTLVDEATLGRIVSGWSVDVGSRPFTAPTLIVAGRRDSVVGHADATALLDRYPRATLAVVEDAGHALLHERPELVAALLGDWLDRVGPRLT